MLSTILNLTPRKVKQALSGQPAEGTSPTRKPHQRGPTEPNADPLEPQSPVDNLNIQVIKAAAPQVLHAGPFSRILDLYDSGNTCVDAIHCCLFPNQVGKDEKAKEEIIDALTRSNRTVWTRDVSGAQAAIVNAFDEGIYQRKKDVKKLRAHFQKQGRIEWILHQLELTIGSSDAELAENVEDVLIRWGRKNKGASGDLAEDDERQGYQSPGGLKWFF